MKENLQLSLQRFTRGFAAFSPAQKVIALLGTGALLLAAVLVFRWVAQPQYAPLFTGLSPADASAVVDKLDGTGTPYQLTDGGTAVLVPQDQVYKTRISLSGAGLPSGKDGGYSLLDNQSLSTSQFQEQTDFKRAMEGELSKTVEAMDGVQTAVVHLALPEKQVFADKQAPPTASVLVATRPGVTLDPEQVQSIVHLVAASIDGMDPAKVTVADSTGRLLTTTDDGTGSGMASTRDQAQQKYQDEMSSKLQAMLDRVVGPGNSRVEVTANLDFDKTTTQTRTYAQPKQPLTLSTDKTSEVYTGANGTVTPNGVVGPDGQVVTGGTGTSSTPSKYDKRSARADNALDSQVKNLVTAPGSVRDLHVAVALDRTAAANNNPQEIERIIRSAAGIQPKRGDSMWLSVLPFDRSGEKAAAAELKAQSAAAATAGRMDTFRNIALGALVLFGLVVLWLRNRKRNRQRAEAASYVIEQLKRDTPPEPLPSPATQLLSLESPAEDDVRRELEAIVERQPEDVAALLRGWLVEK